MSEPTVGQLNGAWWVAWPSEGVTLEASLVQESRDGVYAELRVVHQESGTVKTDKVNLISLRSRAPLVTALEGAHPCKQWGRRLEVGCDRLVSAIRAGEPAVALVAAPADPAAWLLPGLFPYGHTSVLFGDGGSGKSLLTLALLQAGLTGHPMAGAPRGTVRGIRRALYLDWEADRATHEARLWGLGQTSELPAEGALLYRRMARAVADDVPALRRIIERERVEVLVVDSFAMACGTEPETADSATRVLAAIRSLDVTCLIIAHVSKQQLSEGRGPHRPFGSVQVSNGPRSAVSARRLEDDEPGQLTLTLTHEKVNDGPFAKPWGLRFTWGPGGEVLLTQTEADLSRAGLSVRILDALRHGSLSATLLAEELGVPSNEIRVYLGRLEKRNKVVRLVAGGEGKAEKTLWGRAHG